MADELADLLEISPDSAYRRIRAEKPISLEELEKICGHYNISMDQLLHLKTDSFLFTGKLMEDNGQSFETWLDDLIRLLGVINSLKNKHIYFLLKDIPPVEHFHIPELAAFKFFFWMKSILHYDSMKGVKFDLNDKRYDIYHEKSRKILHEFNKVPFTEIWNIESINSTLRQIHFHHEAGSFKSKADVILLYKKFMELIDHFEQQAEAGMKFKIGETPAPGNAEYRMFVNELILGDNTFLLDGDNIRLTFLNHSVIYFINTRDEAFNNRTFLNLQNLINKSTMISKVGEKERANFFNRLREAINARIAAV
jgi:DNA-binding Xre family transcriptional regulator